MPGCRKAFRFSRSSSPSSRRPPTAASVRVSWRRVVEPSPRAGSCRRSGWPLVTCRQPAPWCDSSSSAPSSRGSTIGCGRRAPSRNAPPLESRRQEAVAARRGPRTPAARRDRRVERRLDSRLDMNGVITSWNRGAERLYGYMAAEAVGRPVTLVIPPERIDAERADARSLAHRRSRGAIRNRACAQGRVAVRCVGHAVADQGRVGPDDRRLENRARHHRPPARRTRPRGPARARAPRPGGGASRPRIAWRFWRRSARCSPRRSTIRKHSIARCTSRCRGSATTATCWSKTSTVSCATSPGARRSREGTRGPRPGAACSPNA